MSQAAVATKPRALAKPKPEPAPGMKLTLNRSEFLRALSFASAIVEQRNTIPVLSNVLLEAAGDALRIVSTDLNMQIALTVPANVEGEGTTTVSARLLHGIVREFDDGAQVELKLDEARLQVNSGRSRYKLQTIGRDQFPALTAKDATASFPLPAKDLLTAFRRVQFAQSTEVATRAYLCGVFVGLHDGQLAFAATDGNCLAEARLAAPEAVEFRDVILSTKFVERLSKLIEDEAGDVEIALTAAMIEAKVGTSVLTGKLIDGTYPDYRRVIPANNDKVLRIAAAAFAGAVRRASIIANERTRAVKIDLSADKLTASCFSSEHGTAVEEEPCSWEAGDFVVGLNARYLQDLLAATGASEVEVALADAASPLLFTNPADDTARWVVMPMRV
jgi:DNA polymerase-3 subunit beta